jgi:histidinol-phosphate/aromatic aminotransferase/cobyric acid decarboxylase-like protein
MISRRVGAIPPPGPHGGDGAQVAVALGIDPDDVLDLSVNLNPFAPDVTALAVRELGALRRYPDLDEAESTVADMVNVDRERLVLTAGGAQAIALVADHLGCGWVDEPEFSLYRRHLRRVTPGAPRWRSDPHNPTGQLAPDDAPRPGRGQAAGDGMAVWDEAFLPLSGGTWTRGRPGWALGSLTKAFACPGLRLGFAVAPDGAPAQAMRARRPAWAVGGLACALVPHLATLADPPGWTTRIAAARDEMARILHQYGWEPRPSQAPWLLVPDARGLREALAPQGVVVRDCTSFGLADHVRIAVPDDAGLARLDAALAACSGDGGSR